MARRPDNTHGQLVFQEGKNIEGEFYIIAAYDDASSRTISFAAYELENDCTYTYPLTYSEFDALFKYDSELMNPSNLDGRFHWVIERLDFVQDNQGNKVLCLAQEPTPDEDDEDGAVEEDRPKAPRMPSQAGGKVDAATRAKLLVELDTQDDHKLFVQLVKSESARMAFISSLQAQRLMQVEKAAQRLLHSDEKREERLLKLDVIKKQQAEKAREAKAKEAREKSTMAQLEILMKQKEAQTIRRLIQEKGEEDRGAGREKDAARQKRKMQERSAADVRAIELERAKQMGRKRDDMVVKREALVVKSSQDFADGIFEFKEECRMLGVRRREVKDVLIRHIWEERSGNRLASDKCKVEFEAMEELRDRQGINRDRVRAHKDRDNWRDLRDREAQLAEETTRRRDRAHKEYSLQWKVAATNSALAAREIDRRTSGRAKRIFLKEEIRLRRFRETQFLESRKSGMPSGATGELTDIGQSTAEGFNSTATPAELASFQKSFEQQERERRAGDREEKRKAEDEKAAKLLNLTGIDLRAKEMLRIHDWRKTDSAVKEKLMNAKLRHELESEQRLKEVSDKVAQRQVLTKHLEASRREKSEERERLRIAACVQRCKNLPPGTALPSVLLY